MHSIKHNKVSVTLLALAFLCIYPAARAQSKFKEMADVQLITGYNRGLGFGGNLVLNGLSTEFPFDIRFGLGYTLLNPGNSSDTRRVFINNATNGTPEKKGRSIDLRMDFLKSMTLLGNTNSYWFIGPRYSFFNLKNSPWD